MQDMVVLLVATYAAATISGAAGFGGALLLLPLLVATVGMPQAVPLLTIAQLIGNMARAGFGFTQIKWKPVALFLLSAVPFSIAGALSFIQLPTNAVKQAIGLAILLFVALKYIGRINLKVSSTSLIVSGSVVGFISGLVGSAGPLGATVFLALGLPPVSYVASEAMTALAMHGAKAVVYQHFIALNKEQWLLAGLMGAMMVLGTWTAKRYIERMPQHIFQHFVAAMLTIISIYMLVNG